MNGADWVILGVVLVSVVRAASEGFFHEAFGIAGLVLGYILAAWQYPRLWEWFAPHLKSPWLGLGHAEAGAARQAGAGPVGLR